MRSIVLGADDSGGKRAVEGGKNLNGLLGTPAT